jgi:hypothetical protein
MQMDIAKLAMLAHYRVINGMARSATFVGYSELCAGAHRFFAFAWFLEPAE